jgi:hypothetical protein
MWIFEVNSKVLIQIHHPKYYKINLKVYKIEVKVKINSLLKLHPSMFYGI